MKTKEELNALKEEVETQNKELHELTEEELAQVSGGNGRLPYKQRVDEPDGGEDVPRSYAPIDAPSAERVD